MFLWKLIIWSAKEQYLFELDFFVLSLLINFMHLCRILFFFKRKFFLTSYLWAVVYMKSHDPIHFLNTLPWSFCIQFISPLFQGSRFHVDLTWRVDWLILLVCLTAEWRMWVIRKFWVSWCPIGSKSNWWSPVEGESCVTPASSLQSHTGEHGL